MVKIRLARRGRKSRAIYDVVVADARAPRDGRFIEKLGTYNPNVNPASIEIDDEKAYQWVMNGAQPTDTVRAMLSYRGILLRKHLQIGVNKGAITQEEADKRLAEWKQSKDSQIQSKRDNLAKAEVTDKNSRMEAEAKVKEARTEALLAKKKEAEAALVAEINESAEENAEENAADSGAENTEDSAEA